jgi:hypothetical protein
MTRIGPALLPLAVLSLALAASPALAGDGRESLGVYSNWAAFRDAEGGAGDQAGGVRCYAIAKPRGRNEAAAFASVATWPARGIRGQVHIRLARAAARDSTPVLSVGGRRFELVANGRDAWATDGAMDAAIIAALRSAASLRISARGANGRRFASRYDLEGVATAIDAALVACADRR